MQAKIFRIFCGEYTPDQLKLQSKNYVQMRLRGAPFLATSSLHGGAKIKGATKKIGVAYSPVPVCCFSRADRQLIWETKSKENGTYEFRNIARGLECFVIAFDPNNQYNAVIQDKVIAK